MVKEFFARTNLPAKPMTLKEKLLQYDNCFESNQYFDEYVRLIEASMPAKENKPYTQKHHIIPRNYFFKNERDVEGGWNLVNLSYKDHILAHYYLSFCLMDEDVRYGTRYAFYRMCRENPLGFDISDVCNLERYNELNKLTQEENSKRASIKGKGFKHSEETKRKISEHNSKVYNSEKWVWVTHEDGRTRQIREKEKDLFLNYGWHLGRHDKEAYRKISETQRANPNRSMLGRKQTQYQKDCVSKALKGKPKTLEARNNMSKGRLGKILVSNLELGKSFYVPKGELGSYLAQGYIKGRLK